jgi:hypothetical protein
VVDCIEILKDILREVAETNPEVLKMSLIDLRRLLFLNYRKRIPAKCRDIKVLEAALAAMKTAKGESSWVTVTVELPAAGREITTPGSANYPDFTMAEVIYIGLYEEDPANAHARMYELLEPILLANGGKEIMNIKKALFIPATREVWRPLMEQFAAFLNHLDEERRKTVCRCLEKTIHLLFYSLPRTVEGGRVFVRAAVHSDILSKCPNLGKVLGVG